MRKHFILKSRRIFIIATILFCIISVYLMIRIGVFKTLYPMNSFLNDDVRYLSSAKTLIETGKLTYFSPANSTIFIMPGIVLALVPFVKLFGEIGAVFAFKIFQIILQIFGLYLVGLIAQKCFNDKISKISMIVISVYFTWNVAVNYIYTEVIFTTLFLLLIYLILIAFEENKLKNYIWTGIFWALATLVRPTIAIFPIVVLIMFLIKKFSIKQILKISLVVALTFVVIMSPWWIRNYLDFNRFIPLTLSSGNPMLAGSIIGGGLVTRTEQDLADVRVLMVNNGEIAEDKREFLQAEENIKLSFQENFWGTLKWHTMDKMAYQWLFPWISGSDSNMSFNTNIQNIINVVPAPEQVIIIFFGIVGVLFALFTKANKKNRLFLFLTILYFNFIQLPFVPSPRYMFPVMPLVIIFACYGGIRTYNWIQLKKESDI